MSTELNVFCANIVFTVMVGKVGNSASWLVVKIRSGDILVGKISDTIVFEVGNIQ